ncbi:MAG: EutN/CcmL family microcompartment protein [Lachnospiraceae bacterium]
MIIGRITGSVIATRKNDNLIGSKFMIVEPIGSMNKSGCSMVAIDNVGAGIGEVVLVATGSAARIGCGMELAPIDAAIVGIIDDGAELE